MLLCLSLPAILAAQRIKGSDTVLPLTQSLSEIYMRQNPNATVTVTGGGSGVGISALMEGTTDLAMASRRIKFSEKMKMKQSKHDPAEVIVAYDALAIIVNPENPVRQLTREQLENIFRGKITNWKEVGGKDMKIVVYSRETSSGTYEFFKESVLKNKNYMSSILSMPATGAIIQSVRQTKGAIGYVGLAYLNRYVKALAVSYDGGRHYVHPSVKSAMRKEYPIVRPLYYYYDKKNETAVKPFLQFTASPESRKKTLELGFIPRTVSGFVTSIVILLIIGFLFTEAVGLFSNPVVEKGYVLAVNPANTVERLNAQQIKQIFDEEITNWKDVGGSDMPVKTFRLEDLDKYYSEKELGAEYEHAGKKIAEQIHKTPGIIAFVPDVLVKDQPDVRIMPDNNISVKDVLGGNEWFPTATPSPIFGILPLISGTLWVSFFAILIALPFGLAVSIYMAEVAHFKVRKALKPIIELLNGIPSVVYGFFGLTIIVPFLQNTFNLPVGESGLAGSIVLAIMALPTIITVAEDAMRSCPRSMREASLALGATQWQTIYKVVIPFSMSGITSGVVLGIGRAIGETMAVLMVTGNAAVMPTSILEPLRTIPATIAAELGEAPAGGAHYQALFLLGVILFFITLIINSCVEIVSARNKLKK